MLRIMSIAGARPNFMKLASIVRAVEQHNNASSEPGIKHIIVHTGQHYDQKMSDSFFIDLGIPNPDINLEVGSGSHASQTAEIMKRFEPVLLEECPDILLVVGDVNSTIACTLVAAKIEYPSNHKRRRPIIVHVEAGLRSFDRDMPEEVNRILADSISDLLFTTEEQCLSHLQREGVATEKVHFVGNVMIDTLMQHVKKAELSTIKEKLNIDKPYALVTLHRPSNVDRLETLQPLMDCLEQIAKLQQIVFPVHPRTKNSLQNFGLYQSLQNNTNIILAAPLGYLDFLKLIKDATVVITDSGGIQEETTVLKIPCVTLRENTERPVTVDVGTNYLIGTEPARIMEAVSAIIQGNGKQGDIPPLWDGHAGERIVQILLSSAL
ncbi:MAG TPA: UDP-N-acetylglucosamine 2-epimerase (non-hydrolyzing) [Desulfocapsa sulfexigens]|nr:UDP-N-acetylglucosamine 2-epimerase (non-hydrolyzing) [Desulfocapsa sulfexigens]